MFVFYFYVWFFFFKQKTAYEMRISDWSSDVCSSDLGIINISSVVALAPEVFEGTYSATKAYILNLSMGLVQEFQDSAVRIQVVLPGATRTEIWERADRKSVV